MPTDPIPPLARQSEWRGLAELVLIVGIALALGLFVIEVGLPALGWIKESKC